MQQSTEILGPFQIRKFLLAKVCETDSGHQHHYDHVTVVIAGRVEVTAKWKENGEWIEAEPKVFCPGEFFNVKAEVFHKLKALDPQTQYVCMFSHRDFDGQIVQEYNGNPLAAAALDPVEDDAIGRLDLSSVIEGAD